MLVEPLFVLIIVTLVLLARRDVTVTGPEIEIGLVGLTDIGPEPGVLDVTTDTFPNAVLECWMDTADVIGVKPSDDFPGVSGFTDIDCVDRGGPDIMVWLLGPALDPMSMLWWWCGRGAGRGARPGHTLVTVMPPLAPLAPLAPLTPFTPLPPLPPLDLPTTPLDDDEGLLFATVYYKIALCYKL